MGSAGVEVSEEWARFFGLEVVEGEGVGRLGARKKVDIVLVSSRFRLEEEKDAQMGEKGHDASKRKEDSLEVEIKAQNKRISNLALPQPNEPSNNCERAQDGDGNERLDGCEGVEEGLRRGGGSIDGERRELSDMVRVTEEDGSEEEEEGSEDLGEEGWAEGRDERSSQR